MTGPNGPIRLQTRTVRKGGDLRDTIALTIGSNPYDLTQLDDLEYHLKQAGQTAVVRLKSTAAHRSFPDADAGVGGRITFIALQAVLDAMTVGDRKSVV